MEDYNLMAIHELPTDITGNGKGLLEGISTWAYNATNGVFWTWSLFVFCIILMISTSRFGTPRSFGFASFSGMLGATFLAIAGLLSWGIASIFIIVGFIGFGVMILNER
jgi:hypothetical protein